MDELIYYNAMGKPEDKKNLTSFAYLSSLHTTKIYHQYRQSPSSANGSVNLAIGNGSHLLVALPDKPILHVYLYGKESPEQIIPLPEILTSLTCYRDDNFEVPTLLLGGSISGRLYVWSLNSGLLLTVKQSHYQPLTHIVSHSGFIATGSKDSRIIIHSINSLFMNNISEDNDNNNEKPFAIITDHTLPITSLHFNKGLNNDIKLISSSLDSTVRIYSLTSNIELLTTIVSTNPITALAIDPAFRALYLGMSNGQIRSVDLFKINPKNKIIEAVGGLGKIITLKPDIDYNETFNCHEDQYKAIDENKVSITQLKVSFDGTLLVSGDDKGALFVIDITTKQIRKKLKELVGPISNIELWSINVNDKKFENQSGVDKTLMRTIPVLKRSIVETNDLVNEKLIMKLKDTKGKDELTPIYNFSKWIDNVQNEEKVFANFSGVDSETLGSNGNGFFINTDRTTIKDLKQELENKDAAFKSLKKQYDDLLAEYMESSKNI